MSVYKRGKGTHWHYYFRVRGVRYRGSIPEARTKKDAEQAESKIKRDVFEGRYGKRDTGTMKLSSFIDDIYMPWAKSNKTSWLNDHYNAVTLKDYFGDKKLKEIQPLDVERFKSKRLATETKHDTQRAPASVNREFELLSRVYNLAIEVGKADTNPCQRVKKFKLDNERYRFLTPTEEADLMSWLVKPREHLEPLVIVALGLGLRKQEQLKLRRDQVDFFRNVVVASRTKGKRNREIPMDVLDERVKPILWKLCENKKADEFVFVNPNTKKPYTDVKRAFGTACDLAELRNLEWHDLRATFCTRLAIAGYDAFTIKALMGHRDMKTTERYIRAHRLTRQVALVEKNVHKLATNEIRPPVLAAVSN
jgi:integrase